MVQYASRWKEGEMLPMYCQECGTKANENAKFCSECGRKLPQVGKEYEDRPARVFTVRTVIEDFFQGAIKETKLREMIRKGLIPHTRIDSKILFREEALNKWMEEQENLSIGKVSLRLIKTVK